MTKLMHKSPWYEVFEDREAPGDWRVEAFGQSGTHCVTVFAGDDAEARARQHASWANWGLRYV